MIHSNIQHTLRVPVSAPPLVMLHPQPHPPHQPQQFFEAAPTLAPPPPHSTAAAAAVAGCSSNSRVIDVQHHPDHPLYQQTHPRGPPCPTGVPSPLFFPLLLLPLYPPHWCPPQHLVPPPQLHQPLVVVVVGIA